MYCMPVLIVSYFKIANIPFRTIVSYRFGDHSHIHSMRHIEPNHYHLLMASPPICASVVVIFGSFRGTERENNERRERLGQI